MSAMSDIGHAMGVAGKMAVVTGGGGARNGTGAATAKLLGALGANVAVLDLNRDAAVTTAEEIRQETGTDALARPVDVTDEVATSRVIADVLDHYGRIDILAHLAGGHIGRSLVEDIPTATWQANLALNLTAAFICARSVFPIMKKQNNGKMVFISSEAGLTHGYLSSADYASAKAGQLSLMRQLAFEGGPFGINANSIVPGPTHEADPERDQKDGRLEKVPIGRFPAPNDIAHAVGFLCSRWADAITGAMLVVDGGLLIARTDYETYLAKRTSPSSSPGEESPSHT